MKLLPEKSFKDLTNDYCLLIIRIFLALIFIYSGVTKLFELQGFIHIVLRVKILPEIIAQYFAIILPLVELFLGLCLIFGLYLRWTIKFLIILVSVFIIVIVLTLFRGISVNCGCFGELFDDVIGWETVARDFLFLGLLVFLFTRKKLKYVITM